MMPIRLALSLVLVACLLLVSEGRTQASGSDVSVSVSLNRDKIGLDEHSVLSVTVSGSVQDLPEPQLPTLGTFEVYAQGHSSNISIINGKYQASLTYTYLLLPQKPGSFPIERIGVVYNGKRVEGNSVTLTVLNQGSAAPDGLDDQITDSQGESRDYLLVAEVDDETPYVGQQITLTLKFMVAVRYYGTPEFTEPSTTGFWVESMGNKTPYYQTIGGRRYKAIELVRALFPTQSGELTVGRAAISLSIADKRSRRDPFANFSLFPRGRNVTARSLPLKIDVQPLPTAGRPDDFSGTVGRFNMQVRPDRTTVAVNEPVTVKIHISGTGNIKSVAEPTIPELDDFRIYRASSSENSSAQNDRLTGTKTFEEVFIPRRPGELEIPALSFTYFDPDVGEYRTTRSQPIKLTVTEPEGYVADGENPYRPPDLTIGAEARDIRHIKTDVGHLRRSGQVLLFDTTYLMVNGLPLLALVGLVVVRRRRESLSSDQGRARSRAASKLAKRRLTKARELAGGQEVEPFFGEVHTAVVSFVADKLNISPHGLTVERLVELLSERDASEELVARVQKLLRQCDFARYAPSQVRGEDFDSALAEAEAVMIQLEGLRFA